ncbi:MAG: hypothetical protein ABSG25_01540 [Bryobacteraceae bacterium]
MITTVFNQLSEYELVEAFHNPHDAQKLFKELLLTQSPIMRNYEDEDFKKDYPNFIIKQI